MLRRQHPSINQRFVGVHPVHYKHGSALGEYGQITHELGWEFVDDGGHGVVSKHGSVGDQALPFTFTGDVVLLGQQTFPFCGGEQFWQVCSEICLGFIF
jgi:hypothetical protein